MLKKNYSDGTTYNPYSNTGKANISRRAEQQRQVAGKKDVAKKKAAESQRIATEMAKTMAKMKPKVKQYGEIKSLVKSETPKAGKYVMPYGKIAQIRGNSAARHQDPEGKFHKNPRGNPGTSTSRRTYTVVKGDSLYSIAEKTLPPGKELGSWFNAIKKMNAGRKLFAGGGVGLPAKARKYKAGR